MTQIDLTIFKAYDIRGIYPTQINPDVAYTLATTASQIFRNTNVVICKDARIGSAEIYKSLIQGFLDMGVSVDFLGDATTDTIYYAIGKYEYDLGIAITGSHNPKEYAGFKFTLKGVKPVLGEYFREQVELTLKKDLAIKRGTLGTYKEIDISEEYTNFCLSFVNKSNIKQLKVSIDCGNGVSGDIVKKTFSKLPIKTIELFFEKNGNFPNHLPDPLKEENLVALKKSVINNSCDLGIAFDGDGDRMMIVDNNGQTANGYYLMPLLIESLLSKYPNSKIVHEPRQIWAIVDSINKFGGTSVVSKAGHSFIKEVMRSSDSVFGGETSGHFFYKDNFYADNGLISALIILEYVSLKNTSVSKILEELRANYPTSGEINTKVQNPDLCISKIKEIYTNQMGVIIDETDGISVENAREWRFNVRKSNTEPLVRLNVEGKSKDIVDKIVKEVLDLIVES